MDLILGRLSGSDPLDRDGLEAVLRRQPWLTHRPDDPLRPGGTFGFAGGGLYVVPRVTGDSPYAAPWLHVWLTREHDFRAVAPPLVRLAGELGAGIDTLYPAERWWEAPTSPDPGVLQRSVKIGGSCLGAEAWLLLGFVLSDPACLELAESNAALAVLVARMDWFGSRPGMSTTERRAFFRDLARRRRHEILEWTEGIGSRPLVRILARIAPERLDIDDLRLLTRQGVAPHLEKTLRHQRRLRCSLLPLVADPRLSAHVSPRLLHEAAEADDGWTVHLLGDTLEMAQYQGAPERVGLVSSRAALSALHDRLLEERLARHAFGPAAPSAQTVVLPRTTPPPPAGTATIEPLRTLEELREEGTSMRHCVASYGTRVARGDCAVFRVLAPERATLSLAWRPDRRTWAVEQLCGPGNTPVGPVTQAAVHDWLGAAG